jgi:uncharacterized heparinase superfamily protein
MVLPDFRNAVPDLYIPALLPGDRETAHRLYRGIFSFAGATVTAGPEGIFAAEAPNPAWWRELHGFGWIGDLMGSGFELHRAYARAQLQAWHVSEASAPARRDMLVTARRLIIVAQYWPELLRGASMAFTQDLARIAAKDAGFLMMALPKSAGTREGLAAATALTRLAFSFKPFGSLKSLALSRLSTELERFVLPDGGPETRNAVDLVDVLADLVPLRDALALARREVPPAIHGAIERAMPMLRFFAHGDGGLAFFQGVNALKVRRIRALLERDMVFGRPFIHAVHSGFVRFQQGSSCLIADAKAGPLAAAPFAFEFSDDAHRIVVNCGFPADDNPAWRAACSSTAAHSTVLLGDVEPGSEEPLRRLIGRLKRQPARVIETAVETIAAPQGSVMRGEHNGYAATLGLMHQRSLYLSASGLDLRGEDSFVASDPMSDPAQNAPFTIRFHLHPGVKWQRSEAHGVMLQLPNQARWRFTVRGGLLAVEESIHLAGEARMSHQIVIRGVVGRPSTVNWAFKALGRG